MDKGDSKNTAEAVKELQAAIGDLEGMVVEARINARHSAQEILTHVGCLVTELVAAVDRINWCGRRWANHIGDVQALREDSCRLDLTLVKVVSKVMAAQDAPNEVLTDGLEELSGVIVAVDSDLVK